jgi:hypothetical protein
MERNRVVTGVAVGAWVVLGLPLVVIVAVAARNPMPLLGWLLIPAACLVGVLAQFVLVGPLMLLLALAFRGRKRR